MPSELIAFGSSFAYLRGQYTQEDIEIAEFLQLAGRGRVKAAPAANPCARGLGR